MKLLIRTDHDNISTGDTGLERRATTVPPETSDHRLNVCYNNILRRLLRRPRYCSDSGLFTECGIPNCKAVIRSLIYKFNTCLNESTNDVILAILSSDIRWTSRIRHYWVKTLYVNHDLVV